MDKQKANSIIKEFSTMCAEFGKKHGVLVSRQGGSYTENKLTFRINVFDAGSGVSGNGPAPTKADVSATQFKLYAHKFGLEASDLGKKFSYQNTTYTICGLNPKAPKYPVSVKRADGKGFRMPAIVVLKGLGKLKTPADVKRFEDEQALNAELLAEAAWEARAS